MVREDTNQGVGVFLLKYNIEAYTKIKNKILKVIGRNPVQG